MNDLIAFYFSMFIFMAGFYTGKEDIGKKKSLSLLCIIFWPIVLSASVCFHCKNLIKGKASNANRPG